MGSVYDYRPTLCTEDTVENSYTADESTSTSQYSVDFPSKKRRRQGGMPDILQAKNQMDEAFSIIKERAAAKAIKPEKLDECDLYAQLLAEKLKKIDEGSRIILMHNIDMLVFQEIIAAKQERAASEASAYSYSSHSSRDIINSPIIHPPSPNLYYTIQSTQPLLLPSDHDYVFSQSQEPSSPSLYSSSPSQLTVNNRKHINILSQKIIHPAKDNILAKAYKSINNNETNPEQD